MAKKKRPTNRAQFIKQQERLYRQIKNEYVKMGLTNIDELIPGLPKRVSKKRLNYIKSLSPRDIVKTSGSFIIGKANLTGEQYLELSTRKTKLKHINLSGYEESSFWDKLEKIAYVGEAGSYADNVLDNFKNAISKYPWSVASIILEKIDDAIEIYGKEAVADAIISMDETVQDYLSRSAYYGDSLTAVEEYASAIISHIPNLDGEDLENIYENMEQNETFETEFDMEWSPMFIIYLMLFCILLFLFLLYRNYRK